MLYSEITMPGPLLDHQGRLAQAGFASCPLLIYDRQAVAVNPMLIKEWDHYTIQGPACTLRLSIADRSWLGIVRLTLLTPNHHQIWQRRTPLPRGTFGLPGDSLVGNTAIKNRRLDWAFIPQAPGSRRLHIALLAFQGRTPLIADLLLNQVRSTTTYVLALPLDEDGKSFCYHQITTGFTVEGCLQIGSWQYAFSPEHATAQLDWGRGAWNNRLLARQGGLIARERAALSLVAQPAALNRPATLASLKDSPPSADPAWPVGLAAAFTHCPCYPEALGFLKKEQPSDV